MKHIWKHLGSLLKLNINIGPQTIKCSFEIWLIIQKILKSLKVLTKTFIQFENVAGNKFKLSKSFKIYSHSPNSMFFYNSYPNKFLTTLIDKERKSPRIDWIPSRVLKMSAETIISSSTYIIKQYSCKSVSSDCLVKVL